MTNWKESVEKSSSIYKRVKGWRTSCQRNIQNWKSDFLKASRSKWQVSRAFVVCQQQNFPAGLLSNFTGAIAGLPWWKFPYSQRKRDFFTSRYLPRFPRSILQDILYTCLHVYTRSITYTNVWIFRVRGTRNGDMMF